MRPAKFGFPPGRIFIPLLLSLLPLSALPAQTDWTMSTTLTEDKAYLTVGSIEFSASPEKLWQVLTDYERADAWLVRGLDTPAGWKYPTYIQAVQFSPEVPAMEIHYGLRFFGFLDRDDLSIVFAIRENRIQDRYRLVLTLTEEYPFVTEGEYTLTLEESGGGTTRMDYMIRTKLPPLIRTFLPKGLYNDNVRYFIGQMMVNLHERSTRPLNP